MTRPPAPLVVGLDPGRQTGLAVWDRRARQIRSAATLDFWAALEAVQELSPDEADVVLEDPLQNRPIFVSGKAGLVDVLGAKAPPAVPLSAVRMLLKVARNVGMNQEHGRLLAEGLERLGYAVTRVKPTEGKWDPELARRAFGRPYDGPLSQHAADAVRLVVGR